MNLVPELKAVAGYTGVYTIWYEQENRRAGACAICDKRDAWEHVRFSESERTGACENIGMSSLRVKMPVNLVVLFLVPV